MWDRDTHSLFSSRVSQEYEEKTTQQDDRIKLPRIDETTIPSALTDPQNAILSLFDRNPKFENTESINKLLEIDPKKAVEIIRACQRQKENADFKIVYTYIMENYISQVFSKRDKNKDWQTESNIRSEKIEKAMVVFGILNSITDIANTPIPDKFQEMKDSSQ
jgi:hypothetical protein